MTIEEIYKNRELIIAKKKNAIKHADCVINQFKEENSKNDTSFKAGVDLSENNNPTVLNAKLVINTTNIIDSHMDCHIPGLWKKTLSETKVLYLLQEHDMEFDKIIADSVNDGLKAYTKNVSWSSLGYSFTGNTEALVFETQIKADINPLMFDLYKKGRVLNHSVGMRYSKIYLCINSNEPTYSAEKDNWEKYYPAVANKNIADEKGFFWAVTEAKAIEGSAVVKGSNEATPVMEIEIDKNIEAVSDTSKNEPSKDTQNVNSYYY
jgi:hypothetical protein